MPLPSTSRSGLLIQAHTEWLWSFLGRQKKKSGIKFHSAKPPRVLVRHKDRDEEITGLVSLETRDTWEYREPGISFTNNDPPFSLILERTIESRLVLRREDGDPRVQPYDLLRIKVAGSRAIYAWVQQIQSQREREYQYHWQLGALMGEPVRGRDYFQIEVMAHTAREIEESWRVDLNFLRTRERAHITQQLRMWKNRLTNIDCWVRFWYDKKGTVVHGRTYWVAGERVKVIATSLDDKRRPTVVLDHFCDGQDVIVSEKLFREYVRAGRRAMGL
jgi:hypothetical protein